MTTKFLQVATIMVMFLMATFVSQAATVSLEFGATVDATTTSTLTVQLSTVGNLQTLLIKAPAATSITVTVTDNMTGYVHKAATSVTPSGATKVTVNDYVAGNVDVKFIVVGGTIGTKITAKAIVSQ